MKSGQRAVAAPVYSHLIYDVVPDQAIVIERPDIVIVEGLNVLQPAKLPKDGEAIPFVSDFFDFSIYIDADDGADRELVRRALPAAYVRPRSAIRPPIFTATRRCRTRRRRPPALSIWRTINLVNLRENILPTRQRADLILRKGQDHAVETVALRKLWRGAVPRTLGAREALAANIPGRRARRDQGRY